MSLLQKSGYRLDLLYIFFQLCNGFLFCKRHNLNNKSSCLLHSIVLIHQNSKSYCRGNLLADCKIIRKVFCNLTGLKDYLSGIRLLQPHILNYIKKSDPYCAGNIQFAFVICRNDHLRISHVTLHSSLRIRSYSNSFQRAAGLNLKCENILITLHHHTHHSPCSKQSSKSCRRHRTGIMSLPGCLHCFFRHCREGAHLTVCRCCSYNIITHFIPPESVSLKFCLIKIILYIYPSGCMLAFFLCHKKQSFTVFGCRIHSIGVINSHMLHPCLSDQSLYF